MFLREECPDCSVWPYFAKTKCFMCYRYKRWIEGMDNKRLVLQRKYFKPTYTIGNLFIDGIWFCNTLEDTVRTGEKIPGQTAIPAGTYKVFMGYSPRFGRLLPTLKDVPDFTHILIHPGNDESNTEGCILVGRNTEIGHLTESRMYSDKLNEVLGTTADIEITII